MKAKRIVLGVVLGAIVAGGLYLANRFWIAPATAARSAKSDGAYPMAPEFKLTSLSGQTVNLRDLRGKVVILDFWATWCGPCRLEIPEFEDLQRKYGSQGLQVVGVSMDDSSAPVRQFYQQFKMNYPVVMGTDKVGELYGGIYALPTSFVIGRDGRIYAKHVGAMSEGVFLREVRQLLAARPNQPLASFTPAVPGSADISVETPAEVNSPVPGVDVSKLSAAQLAEFKKKLSSEHCTCGCGYTVLQCREVDGSCPTSLKMAREAMAKLMRKNSI